MKRINLRTGNGWEADYSAFQYYGERGRHSRLKSRAWSPPQATNFNPNL